MKKQTLILIIVLSIIILTGSTILFCCFHNKTTSSNYCQWQTVIQSEWDAAKPVDAPSFLKTINNLSEFRVISVEETETNYFTIKVSVSSPDISCSLVEYQNCLSKEEVVTKDIIDKEITNIIKNAKLKTTEQIIYALKDTNGNYHIQFTEDFLDAMFGYAYNNALAVLTNESALEFVGE